MKFVFIGNRGEVESDGRDFVLRVVEKHHIKRNGVTRCWEWWV